MSKGDSLGSFNLSPLWNHKHGKDQNIHPLTPRLLQLLLNALFLSSTLLSTTRGKKEAWISTPSSVMGCSEIHSCYPRQASGIFFWGQWASWSWLRGLEQTGPWPKSTLGFPVFTWHLQSLDISCLLSDETKNLGKVGSLGNFVHVAIFSLNSTGRNRELEIPWSKSATWNVVLENNTAWKNIFLKKSSRLFEPKIVFSSPQEVSSVFILASKRWQNV